MSEQLPGGLDPNRTTLARYQQLSEVAGYRLSRLLEVARLGCGVARAVLALFDKDRQWLSSIMGQPAEGAARLQMLCGYAATRGEPFVIEDLWADPQFAQERAAREGAGLRLFAAAPLVDAAGILGVLCLFDPQPRALSASQRQLLALSAQELAAHLAVQGELRLLQDKHREHLGQLELFGGVLRAASHIVIVGTDLDGTIRSFHGGGERLLGYRAEEVVGVRPLLDLHDTSELEARTRVLLGQEPRRPFEVLTEHARRGGADEGEWLYRRKDGSTFPAALNLTGLRSEEGALTGFVAIVQDLTEQKRLDQLKSEFVSVVSHELRTPLTSIRGALRLLLGGVLGVLPANITELLQIADSNSDRLLRLINDILDFEKLASGTLVFENEPCDLGALLDKALADNRSYGEGYSVTFAREGERASAWVFGDPGRLSQVLANLLSNAAKFSPSGAVVRAGLAAAGEQVRVWVRDEGPGIPEEFRPYVFQRFMQASPADHRMRGGTGLGLSIVRSIIERHGGTVGFETAPNQGTTFHFMLPSIPTPPGE